MMSIDSNKTPTKAVYLLVIIFSSFYPAGVVSRFDVKLCFSDSTEGMGPVFLSIIHLVYVFLLGN